ncbi:MAG: hypothetical protein M3N21_05690 [Actinomycetota bacterium]|nr:hypothetical protein [Actinomycetota bacterium]
MSADRCDLTDLLTDQCACRKHRNSAPLDTTGPVEWKNAWTRAAFTTRCALDKTHAIEPDDTIHLTSEGWACQACRDAA